MKNGSSYAPIRGTDKLRRDRDRFVIVVSRMRLTRSLVVSATVADAARILRLVYSRTFQELLLSLPLETHQYNGLKHARSLEL